MIGPPNIPHGTAPAHARELTAVRNRRAWQLALLLVTLSCGSIELAAQPDVSRAQRLVCRTLPKTSPTRRLESVPARDSLEACRALTLAIAAAKNRYPGRVDSAMVWRHDVPELGTTHVQSFYQIGVYITPRPYVEVVVDRTTWAVSVQFLEGR